MGRYYAYIGNWSSPSSNGPRGILQAEWDGTAHRLIPGKHFGDGINCGAFHLDQERRILYCVNELPEVDGVPGGQVIAFRINSDGTLTELNRQSTLGPQPSYCAVSADAKFLIVTNHSTRNSIVRTIQDENGRYRLVREYDEASIVLFPLNADGSIDAACHVVQHENCGPMSHQQGSHLHSVVLSPNGRFLAVCDKGNDSFHLYRIDGTQRKLIQCDSLTSIPGSAPRYCVFHPTLPLIYFNHETRSVLSAVSYSEDGKLSHAVSVSCREDGDQEKPGFQSDLLLDHGGRYLYDLVREGSQIAVFSLDEKAGIPKLLYTVDCGTGRGGRSLALPGDGKILYLAGSPDKEVVAFSAEGGTLTNLGTALEDAAPGCLAFCPVERG